MNIGNIKDESAIHVDVKDEPTNKETTVHEVECGDNFLQNINAESISQLERQDNSLGKRLDLAIAWPNWVVPGKW